MKHHAGPALKQAQEPHPLQSAVGGFLGLHSRPRISSHVQELSYSHPVTVVDRHGMVSQGCPQLPRRVRRRHAMLSIVLEHVHLQGVIKP
ncbi:hypothetical protein [Kocuria rosea]|uniref:hypothetical protein n=1 Tax=Kocuria rosea TaxID=1275 RepID=UPI00232F629F|nr:hypothetical protein [Kocuria rosea]